MPFSQDVKELAYTIDPPCWISYSGKPRYFKAAMDERRDRSLKQAQSTIDRLKRRRGHLWRQAEDQGVGITHAEATFAENFGG